MGDPPGPPIAGLIFRVLEGGNAGLFANFPAGLLRPPPKDWPARRRERHSQVAWWAAGRASSLGLPRRVRRQGVCHNHRRGPDTGRVASAQLRGSATPGEDDDDDDDDGGGGGGGGDDGPPRPPTAEIVQDFLCFTQCRKPFPTTSCQERAVAGCSTPHF